MKRMCLMLLILLVAALSVPAMAAGNGETTYRALLIGIDAYQPTPLAGCVNDVNRMSQALQAANDAGAFYQAPVIRSNLESAEIQSLENDMATWNVDEDDVTFFYFAGRCYMSDKGTPAIVGKDSKMFPIADLASLLGGIKGTKMVALDMRFPDDMLNGAHDALAAQGEMAAFNQAVLKVFQEAEDASDFYVLSATTLASSEEKALPAGAEARGLVTYLLSGGCGYDYVEQRPTDQLLADANGNGAISLTEARDYIVGQAGEMDVADQIALDVAISPEGSTYPLLARRATSEVLEVVLKEDAIEVPMGRTRQLEAETQPPNASKRTISWSSSDLSIATVNDDGVVTGIKPGTVRVAATTANGLTVFADVTVRDVTMVENLALNTSKLTVGNNATVQLNLTIDPADASENISWTTGNAAIATVDQSGQVTCHSNGDTVITVASESGVEATCAISVVEPQGVVTNIRVNHSSLDMFVGGTEVLQYKLKPAEPTDPSVTFTSSDPNVAAISGDSIVTAVGPGECTVYATASSGVYAPIPVTVKGPELQLSKESASLRVGGTAVLQTKVQPKESAGTITWESADPSIATVENAKITGVAEGETTITATLGDGLATATCTVAVVGKPVKKIAVKPAKMTLEVGAVENLSYEINPSDASTAGVKWSSSNEEIAVIDEEGHVTAIAAGRVNLVCSAPSGAKARCQLIVRPVAISSVTLDRSELKMVANTATSGKYTLIAQTEPSGAGNGSLRWISSNPKVASVSASGEVTARRPGKAIIKAAAKNGKNVVSATCNVLVEGNMVANKTPETGSESKVYTSARRIRYFRGVLMVELYFVNKTGDTAIVPEAGKVVMTLADGRQFLIKEVEAGKRKLKAGKSGVISYTATATEDSELYGLDLRGARAELMPMDYELNAVPNGEIAGEAEEAEEAPAAQPKAEAPASSEAMSADAQAPEDFGEEDEGAVEYENESGDVDWDAPETEGWAVDD